MDTREAFADEFGPYGLCPICAAKGVSRQRRPDGDDKCARGHTYPSRDALVQAALKRPVMSEAEAVEVLAKIEHDQWMQWAKTLLLEEAITIKRKERWIECMKPYHELSEEMKEHDRVWARIAYKNLLAHGWGK